jgi:RNA 3'-terminal phosphate cyclase (ATP)
MSDLISIDGSFGEGGGQILRTSLALSAITGRPIEIRNIRAGREKPGLQAQHLRSVEATAEICQGKTRGADLHSTLLRFEPGEVRPGDYQFDIGTAGATGLVLHTVYLPLALQKETSHVGITGGTHNPFSPCFHYLEQQWMALLAAAGFRLSLKLDRAGFYPVGGGKIRVEISPAEVSALQLTDRGSLALFQGLSLVANLDISIAERQKAQALRHLRGRYGIQPRDIETAELKAPSPGTAIILTAEFEGGARACYFGLGARGKRAEKVADEAAEPMRDFLSGDATVDEHAADQLLLPLAFAPGVSAFSTPAVTQHLLTNAEVIRMFLNTEIRIRGEKGQPGQVEIVPGTPAGG